MWSRIIGNKNKDFAQDDNGKLEIAPKKVDKIEILTNYQMRSSSYSHASRVDLSKYQTNVFGVINRLDKDIKITFRLDWISYEFWNGEAWEDSIITIPVGRDFVLNSKHPYLDMAMNNFQFDITTVDGTAPTTGYVTFNTQSVQI